MIFSLDGSVFRREGTPYLNTKVMTDAPLDMEMRKRYLGMFWGSYCSRVGTFWNRKCRKKTWWQQEFAVFKCEATANSVTGHACVSSNWGIK